MEKIVTQIPATLNALTAKPILSKEKRKVAGYARVSTAKEEQQSSYEAQRDYYTEYITRRNDWEFVGIYTDEGITGTSTKNREGFNRMVEDALAGKIDLIITKSVSRFARNTVDSLTTVRKLKEKGIEIYFEKENIWTLDSAGELLITIMSSLAQEESRSISENTKWGKRKSFADGKIEMAYSTFLGYGKGFSIIEDQAETVRMIYQMYLDGMAPYSIVKKLNALGRETATGRGIWHVSTVVSILTNEKYKGDALLQKTYTPDFLAKKRVKNHGEIPMYYVEHHHDPIVEPAVFDAVQEEIKRRQANKVVYRNCFSGRLICGECGAVYGRRVLRSNSKYRRRIWVCSHKYSKNKPRCHTPYVTEEEQIKPMFEDAMNQIIKDRNYIIRNVEELISLIPDEDTVKDRINELDGKLKELVKESNKLINSRAENAYKEYNRLAAEYDEKKEELAELEKLVTEVDVRKKRLRQFIAELQTAPKVINSFDEEMWEAMIDTMTIYSRDNVEVKFRDGSTAKVEVPEWVRRNFD